MPSSSLLKRYAVSVVLASAAIGSSHAAPPEMEQLRQHFINPPDDARVMMRWWWFGSAVTKPELEREMKVMKAGGLGGFEVQPVYPLEPDDPSTGFVNLPYLSDAYLDTLKFAADKSRELGLRMDVTLGSGWPFGGPHTPISEAAGALRCDRIVAPANATSLPMPSLANGEKFIAAFLARGDRRQFEPSGIQQLTKFENNRIILPSGTDARNVVLVFISSRSGMQVKRPAVGAEGFVLDHYDRTAIEHHLNVVGTKLMQAFGSHPPYSVFSDSLENFGSDWTPELLSEFQKRRGYDLTPYLPALVGDLGEKTGSVRRDWGRTLSELADERYLTPISEWAHRHGTKFRSQTYGEPPVTLSSNALVDLPEGEAGPRWRSFSAVRWASSASHLYDRPVTSSETWTWLHSPAFRATPLDMKAEADLHFLQGINQLVGHGWAYSPTSAGEPGWRFYAAAVFNEHNPWWIVMPDVTRYLQRVSFLMRQGKPANDIAVYLPTDDAMATFRAGGQDSVDRAMDQLLGNNLVPQLLDAGYNFDFIDDGAISTLGVNYPVLILPNVHRIPLATLRKISDYASKGGKVVVTRGLPSLSTGLQDAADTPQVKLVAGAMPIHMVTDETKLGISIAGLLQPDFEAGDPAIGFIHRHLPSGDIYFVANTGNLALHTRAILRNKNASAEWWDPFSGTASGISISGGVPINLEPYESRILAVFPGTSLEPPPGKSAGTVAELDFQNTSWTDYFSGSKTFEQSLTLPSFTNHLFIDFGPGTPLPASRLSNGMRAWLDPPVREAATVYVNGQLAGYVWHPPFRLDITNFVHSGDNQFKVVVANTAINELAGQAPPDYRLLTLRYGNRFQPQDMDNLKPLPSGIMGKVTLVSE